MGVQAIDDGDEVTFEGLDGPFGWVPAMVSWWYRLILKLSSMDGLD